jgi:hypothetical protein
MESASAVCPSCSLPVLAAFYFCPNCGKQLRDKQIAISLGEQVGIYLLSALLPPLGLWPAIKYLKRSDPISKRVGIIAIVLTLFSIIISMMFLSNIINQTMQQFNTLNTGF